MIRAVVSDFGGVLTTPLFQSFAAFQEESGIPLESIGRAMARATGEDGVNPLFELEVGRMSEVDFLERIADALEAEVGRRVTMDRFADRYWQRLEPNAPMIDWLRGARDRGLRLALLTNNVREWEPRWRPVWDIDALFEVVVDSAFVGMRKPDPGIYELTLDRLALPAGECLFLDDLELNCDAARDVGMHAVHFRDAQQAIPDLEAVLDAEGAPAGAR